MESVVEKKSSTYKVLQVESKEALELILQQCGVDAIGWRTRLGVKTSRHLWAEIHARESILSLRKKKGKQHLIRLVSRVYLNIFCRYQGKLLYLREMKQVFTDGGCRYRNGMNRPSLAEKIKLGESTTQAFVRALREELAFSGGYTVACRKKVSIQKKHSKSYPGLMSLLTTYSFHVELSPKQYRKRYVEVQPDKKTFFEWCAVLRNSRFTWQY